MFSHNVNKRFIHILNWFFFKYNRLSVNLTHSSTVVLNKYEPESAFREVRNTRSLKHLQICWSCIDQAKTRHGVIFKILHGSLISRAICKKESNLRYSHEWKKSSILFIVQRCFQVVTTKYKLFLPVFLGNILILLPKIVQKNV